MEKATVEACAGFLCFLFSFLVCHPHPLKQPYHGHLPPEHCQLELGTGENISAQSSQGCCRSGFIPDFRDLLLDLEEV